MDLIAVHCKEGNERLLLCILLGITSDIPDQKLNMYLYVFI